MSLVIIKNGNILTPPRKISHKISDSGIYFSAFYLWVLKKTVSELTHFEKVDKKCYIYE